MGGAEGWGRGGEGGLSFFGGFFLSPLSSLSLFNTVKNTWMSVMRNTSRLSDRKLIS